MGQKYRIEQLSLDNDLLISKAAELISTIGKQDKTYFFASAEDVKNEYVAGCEYCLLTEDDALVALCDWSWSHATDDLVNMLVWVKPIFWSNSELKSFLKACFSEIKKQAKIKNLNSVILQSRVTELQSHRSFFESLGFECGFTSYLIEIDFSNIKAVKRSKYKIKQYDHLELDAWKRVVRALFPNTKDSYFSNELKLMRKDDFMALAYRENNPEGLIRCVINHEENNFYGFHDSWIQEFIALKNKKTLKLELLNFAKCHLQQQNIRKFKWATHSEKELDHLKSLGFTVFQKRLYYKKTLICAD